MKIGYIYLFGEEWEEWKKHNKSIPEIIDELNLENCDKIYMDSFIPYQEVEAMQQIERIDMKALIDRTLALSHDEGALIIRGRTKEMDEQELLNQVKKEVNRIDKLHNKKI